LSLTFSGVMHPISVYELVSFPRSAQRSPFSLFCRLFPPPLVIGLEPFLYLFSPPPLYLIFSSLEKTTRTTKEGRPPPAERSSRCSLLFFCCPRSFFPFLLSYFSCSDRVQPEKLLRPQLFHGALLSPPAVCPLSFPLLRPVLSSGLF